MPIKVKNIHLVKLDFEFFPPLKKEITANLKIITSSKFRKKNELIQHISFDLFHDIKDSPIRLAFSFVAHYLEEGKTEDYPSLKEFAKYHAPAYVVPYARELIANITSRIGVIPPLIIPPINIFAFLEKSEKESLEIEKENTELKENSVCETDAKP